MNLWSRTLLLFNMKASAALDAAEDPREVLDYAYAERLDLVGQIKRGLIDVATARRRLERQAQKLRDRVAHHGDQAGRALDANREDLARLALERKQAGLAEIAGVERQLAGVAEDERKLTQAYQQVAARVEEFRTHREVVYATYTAAEAQVRVHEALTGATGDLVDLNLAVLRVEERAERMQARASAIDDLLDANALDLPGTQGVDAIERELRQEGATRAVEYELNALKAQRAQQHDEGSQSHE
jgi:phage shock protein A